MKTVLLLISFAATTGFFTGYKYGSHQDNANDKFADYLYSNYQFDCRDDAFTVGLWLRNIDTTESETVTRYKANWVIDPVLIDNL